MGMVIVTTEPQTSLSIWRVFQDSKFPKDTGINPHLAHVKQPAAHLVRSGGIRLSQTFQAHSHAVSR